MVHEKVVPPTAAVFGRLLKEALAVTEPLAPVPGTRVEKMAYDLLKERGESHGFAHACRVRDIAMSILDDPTVEIAALFHDILDHKYVDEATWEGQKLRKNLETFLNNSDVAANDVLAICGAISYSKEKRARDREEPPPWSHLAPELQFRRHCVSDADKIDAIGPQGLKRCVQYRMELNEDDPRAIITDVANHCDDKLLNLLPEYLHTEKGKAIAQPHHTFLHDWRRTVQPFLQ